MAVMMVTGNAARMPLSFDSLFRPARTMTATIAAEMGEVARGSTHYHILFGVGIIIVWGSSAISWEFLTAMPSDGMKAGGIFPAIFGTIILMLGTALASIPVGVGGAIYLAEYARDTWLTRAIRLAIVNLAGIPSVVYGLFGLGLFVLFLELGTSIIAGALTLAIMTLPIIISTAEEALRAVPTEFRTIIASLGGTRWQGIRGVVLPQAFPGLITGI